MDILPSTVVIRYLNGYAAAPTGNGAQIAIYDSTGRYLRTAGRQGAGDVDRRVADQGPDLDGNPRTVGSLSIWDLQGTYAGFRHWKLTLGVKNLFDRDPPASNQLTSFISGFDPSYYDSRARFVYGSVTYTFK